jgi:hypothetical protein
VRHTAIAPYPKSRTAPYLNNFIMTVKANFAVDKTGTEWGKKENNVRIKVEHKK